MFISSEFDSGNIECLSCDGDGAIELNIRKDRKSDFYQWFHFRLTGAKSRLCHISIMNAGGAAYVDGFKQYRLVASYDRETWFRVDTEFDGAVLSFDYRPDQDSIYFAYFAPYTMVRHSDLIAQSLVSERVEYERLGATVDGQDIDLLCIRGGDVSASLARTKKSAWVIARQHPGETMAQWCAEGFIQRLLDRSDPVARELLKLVDVYVVPNMNPDGSRRGHLRTNAVGRNLNREWAQPCEKHSPEVYWVLEKMTSVGVDFCLDMHGDEALPYNFIAGAEGVPRWCATMQMELDAYKCDLMKISPDFQVTHGYPVNPPGEANLAICTDAIAERFGCLAMTLEMPFKDTVDTPNEQFGWSPARSKILGAANVDAMLSHFSRG